MCRIAGIIDFNSSSIKVETVSKICDTMASGGPDGHGVYINGNVGLGHRRLSILDLSSAASQPMETETFVITYNGEVYNFQEIRSVLIDHGHSFRTNSDTEVIIESFKFWGKDAVNKFKGMFAFAIFNKQSGIMTLCRDRFGVKPLYYYWKDGVFIFASELKAFHEYSGFDKTLDLSGLPHFFQKGYFSQESCIYKYVKKIESGTFLDVLPSGEFKFSRYWQVSDTYPKISNIKSVNELIVELEGKLLNSFKLRLVSDVEIGVFLSGGIDSSLIASVLQKESFKPLRTFTLGFDNLEFNEADVAQEVASLLGTLHETIYLKPDDLLSTISILPEIFDEPFGDSSAIPTYVLSKHVADKVKVVLSGDGGDELFGGYTKYAFVKKSKWLLRVPLILRRLLYRFLLKIHPRYLINILKLITGNNHIQLNVKYFKLREVLIAKDIDDLYEKTSNLISDADVKLLTKSKIPNGKSMNNISDGYLISYLGIKDVRNYLLNDILTKVDRSTMSVGLEAREPFLDEELLEFAMGLPDKFKIDNKIGGKYLLKKILGKHVNIGIVERPKQGFTVPIEDWLNGSLKNQVIDIESDKDFFMTFNLNADFYKKLIKSFYNDEGKYNPYSIWNIYCLYIWYKRWV
jgi:asparagine synthase (glutamine-hydrolysing)